MIVSILIIPYECFDFFILLCIFLGGVCLEKENTKLELGDLDFTEKSINRKREILTIASDFYFKYGYHGTTLEAIAAKLGITRAALYRYFTSKDDLFFQCHEAAYGQFLKELELLTQIRNPEIRLTKMLEGHILLLLRDFPTFGPILLSFRSLPDEYRKRVNSLRMKVERIYLEAIHEWRRVSPQSIKEMDDQFLLNVLLSSVNAVPRWGKREDYPGTIAKEVVSILIDGIKK